MSITLNQLTRWVMSHRDTVLSNLDSHVPTYMRTYLQPRDRCELSDEHDCHAYNGFAMTVHTSLIEREYIDVCPHITKRMIALLHTIYPPNIVYLRRKQLRPSTLTRATWDSSYDVQSCALCGDHGLTCETYMINRQRALICQRCISVSNDYLVVDIILLLSTQLDVSDVRIKIALLMRQLTL